MKGENLNALSRFHHLLVAGAEFNSLTHWFKL